MLEYIIIGGLCLIVVGILGYFLFRKLTSQQEELNQVIHRQRAMEAFVFKPSPRQEIKSLFETEPKSCESCDLEPLKLETPATRKLEFQSESEQSDQSRVQNASNSLQRLRDDASENRVHEE